MSIWRWSDLIEPIPEASRITLGEGETPLIRSRAIGPAVGLPNLYFKLEQSSPTGSYKDRFAAGAVSHMLATGKTKCIATSSGNTGAALAAYCAAAAIECRIAIVEGAPLGKLKQMLAYGAKLARVRRFGMHPETTTEVFQILDQIGHRPEWSLQISAFRYSAPGMSAVKTISFELNEQFPQPIDHVLCPAGGGGLCLAVARGFRQLVAMGKRETLPAVECVQPSGNNTISGPLRDGAADAQAVECTSQISGLQVGSVIDGDQTIAECRATGGSGHLVEDEYVWKIQQRLAREEGIFSEPAGAVALAGALQALEAGTIRPDATVVCLVTGSGFKDGASVDRMIADSECPIIDPAELASW